MLPPVPGSVDAAAPYGEMASINASHIVERNGPLTFRRVPVKFIKQGLLQGIGGGGLLAGWKVRPEVNTVIVKEDEKCSRAMDVWLCMLSVCNLTPYKLRNLLQDTG